MIDAHARNLFTSVIAELDKLSARYLLVRNHSGYPDHFTGDVDIYVDLAQVRPALRRLTLACSAAGWGVMRTTLRPWVIALQCVRAVPGAGRTVMVIELFDRFTWLSFPYASFDQVWQRRTRARGLDVLDDDLGIALTVGHYLFWAGFLPEKYQPDIRRALSRGTLDAVLDELFGPRLGRRLATWMTEYASLRGGAWQTMPNVPERILKASRGLRFRAQAGVVGRYVRKHPVRAFASICRVVSLKVKEFFVLKGDVLLVEERGWELLEQVKKYHLYKNRNTILLRPKRGHWHAALLGLWRAYWAMSRGGLCIVEASGPANPTARVFPLVFGRHVKRIELMALEGQPLIDAVVAAVR